MRERAAGWLRGKPVSWAVADLGCGDAQLAETVPQAVQSFDLVAANERVTACDIAHVPLPDGCLDACVFCLALMGVNYTEFLREAHRLLKKGGTLKIAEVASRFADVDEWVALLYAMGFDLVDREDDNTHFIVFEFAKAAKRAPDKKPPRVRLRACIYKRR